MAPKVKVLEGNWYDLPFGAYCGVYLDEETARDVEILLQEYKTKLEILLERNKDKILSGSWGLAYPNGVQTLFHYSREIGDPVDQRLKVLSREDVLALKKIDRLYLASGPWTDHSADDLKNYVTADLEIQEAIDKAKSNNQ